MLLLGRQGDLDVVWRAEDRPGREGDLDPPQRVRVLLRRDVDGLDRQDAAGGVHRAARIDQHGEGVRRGARRLQHGDLAVGVGTDVRVVDRIAQRRVERDVEAVRGLLPEADEPVAELAEVTDPHRHLDAADGRGLAGVGAQVATQCRPGLVDRGQALKLEVDRGPDDRQRPSDEDGDLLLAGEVGRVDVLQRAVDGAVEVLQERRTRAEQVGDDAAQVLVDDLLGSDRDAPGGVLPAAAAVDRAQRHAVRPEEHEAFFEVVGQHPSADRRVRGQLGELQVAEIGRQPTEAQAGRLHEPRRKRDQVAVGGGGEQTAGHHPIPL